MARCLSWSFFPSFEMTAGRAGRGESERRTFGWRGKRRTVCEEYIKKGEMVGAGDVEEVVGAGLAEGGPIDEPSFAGAAGGECHKTIFGMIITYWCELDQKSVAICARHGTKSDFWGLGGRDDAEDASTVGTLEVSRLRFGSRSIHGLRSRARDPAATGSTESTVRPLCWRPLVVPDAFAYARSWCALFRAFMCLLPCAA